MENDQVVDQSSRRLHRCVLTARPPLTCCTQFLVHCSKKVGSLSAGHPHRTVVLLSHSAPLPSYEPPDSVCLTHVSSDPSEGTRHFSPEILLADQAGRRVSQADVCSSQSQPTTVALDAEQTTKQPLRFHSVHVNNSKIGAEQSENSNVEITSEQISDWVHS